MSFNHGFIYRRPRYYHFTRSCKCHAERMQKAEQQAAEQRQHDIDLYGSAYVRKRENGSGFGSFLEDYGLGIAIVVFLVFFLMPI